MESLGPDGLHTEAVLAAGYSVLLLLVAFGIQRMAHRSHRRAHAYTTAGFVYHAHLDAWECPTGEQLHPFQIDEARRVARYRARAAACNRCPLKSGCTDSDVGREVLRSLDPWLETETGRFYAGLSLVLAILACLIISVALVRNHTDSDVLLLLPMLLVVLFIARQRARDLPSGRSLSTHPDGVA